MKKTLLLLTLLFSWDNLANPSTYVTVEEARINTATKEIPAITSQFSPLVSLFEYRLNSITTFSQLHYVADYYAQLLWKSARSQLQKNETFDDRALYWARLKMAKYLRTSDAFRIGTNEQQKNLMFEFELVSRGKSDVKFQSGTDKKILVTGFDPFFLDRNITQSNPSGIAALFLDGKVIEYKGVTAQIEAFVVPVRFADFDQGMIENLLTDYYKSAAVDMITTISMGRTDFDLERFPALRRSANAPGNLNIYTGASSQRPLKPYLNGKQLSAPEFLEFSLPVKAMQTAKGRYKINDNAKVQTLAKGKITASSLIELQDQISVNGSGGGYMSNEISFRSLVLRNQLNPELPVGHIHTPRIKQWQYEEVKAITEQIQQMLKAALAEL